MVSTSHSFVSSLTRLFAQQTFLECLLCAKHRAVCRVYKGRVPVLGAPELRGAGRLGLELESCTQCTEG